MPAAMAGLAAATPITGAPVEMVTPSQPRSLVVAAVRLAGCAATAIRAAGTEKAIAKLSANEVLNRAAVIARLNIRTPGIAKAKWRELQAFLSRSLRSLQPRSYR